MIIGPTNRSQLVQYMHEMIAQFKEITGQSSFFDINIPMSYDGKPRCCAYVYVSNAGFYHALLGKNVDGSERVLWVEESSGENVQNDEEEELPSLDDFMKSNSSLTTKEWSSVSKETSYRKEVLPPLLRPIGIPMNDIQKEYMKHHPSEDYDGECYYPYMDGGFVYEPEPHYVPNVLVCRGIEKWMTHQDIFKLFQKFSNSSQKIYPKVELKGNYAHIIYDPATRDAQFALIMMKKRTIYGKNKEVANLFCNFLYQKSTM